MVTQFIPYLKIPEELPVRPGEQIILAADVTRLAMIAVKKEGGFDPRAFNRAFLEKIGKSGTLVLPAYNFNMADGSHYDPVKTPPATGTLAVAAMDDPGFCRTRNPLHSFLVAGAMKDRLCLADNMSSFGGDSPFALLYGAGASMLFLGVSLAEAFTFVHFVEEKEQVVYRKYKRLTLRYHEVTGSSSEKHYLLYAKKRGWTMNLERLEELLERNGLVSHGAVNGIPWQMISLRDSMPVLLSDIRLNRSRNIARFSMMRFCVELVKEILGKLHIYRTPADKIAHGTGLL
jgi:aminoglycoside 3-N-acetyltransferase